MSGYSYSYSLRNTAFVVYAETESEGGTNIREMEMGSIAEEVRITLYFIAR